MVYSLLLDGPGAAAPVKREEEPELPASRWVTKADFQAAAVSTAMKKVPGDSAPSRACPFPSQGLLLCTPRLWGPAGSPPRPVGSALVSPQVLQACERQSREEKMPRTVSTSAWARPMSGTAAQHVSALPYVGRAGGVSSFPRAQGTTCLLGPPECLRFCPWGVRP